MEFSPIINNISNKSADRALLMEARSLGRKVKGGKSIFPTLLPSAPSSLLWLQNPGTILLF
uniref:Uncharacterized protein n=1 Tax=Cucumis melo TaxID=3656 RepID=A0A9I9EIX9_CUCME